MNKVFEKILERLEADEKHTFDGCINKRYAKKIVQEVAEEYNNGWIPCCNNNCLPKDNEYVRVTNWTGVEKIGFRQYGKWFVYSSEGLSEATVIAWQPTNPYKEGRNEGKLKLSLIGNIRDKAKEWNNHSTKKVPYEFIDFVEGKCEITKDDDVCEWKYDGDNLITSCGDYFNLYDNCTGKFKYCPVCGKKIKVVE